MKRSLAAFILLACMSFACDEENTLTAGCHTAATVRDLSGLDGCGFVFELEDGTQLEPVRLIYCGTMSDERSTNADVLFNFEFVDGKKVLIDYEEQPAPSICMVGPTVRITCITEVREGDPVAR